MNSFILTYNKNTAIPNCLYYGHEKDTYHTFFIFNKHNNARAHLVGTVGPTRPEKHYSQGLSQQECKTLCFRRFCERRNKIIINIGVAFTVNVLCLLYTSRCV